MFTYFSAFLAILLIGGVCMLIIHRAHGKHAGEDGNSAKKRREERHSAGKMQWAKRDDEHRLVRQLHSVRTPWGWGQAKGDRTKRGSGLSESMKSFSDRLAGQKKQLQGRKSAPRKQESVRALLEDRPAKPNRNSINEIEYRKVKAPLLRDPNAPPDQMDNFGIKQVEVVRKKLQRVVKMDVEAATAAKQDDLRYVELKDVKQPWGW